MATSSILTRIRKSFSRKKRKSRKPNEPDPIEPIYLCYPRKSVQDLSTEIFVLTPVPIKKQKPLKIVSKDSFDLDLDFIASHTNCQSREVVARQYEKFLEKLPDGKMTKQSFKKMVRAFFPERNASKLESHIFRIYDPDGDGTIDFKEFMVVLYTITNGTPEDKLRNIFRHVAHVQLTQLNPNCKLIAVIFKKNVNKQLLIFQKCKQTTDMTFFNT